MRTNSVKNGLQLPRIGFGTANLGIYAKEAIFCAIQAGYRLIDTAAVYGSEEAVGEAVNAAIQSGVATREEFFIQSKMAPQKHGYDEAMRSFENSLAKLKLDYLDAFLIHWPVPRGQEDVYREKNTETWRAFLNLRNGGGYALLAFVTFLKDISFGSLKAAWRCRQSTSWNCTRGTSSVVWCAFAAKETLLLKPGRLWDEACFPCRNLRRWLQLTVRISGNWHFAGAFRAILCRYHAPPIKNILKVI